MEILTATKKVDLDVLIMASWKALTQRVESAGKKHVWLIRKVNNYFQLESTRHKIKPQSKDCWYLGYYEVGMTREEFSSQFPNHLADAFIHMAIH